MYVEFKFRARPYQKVAQRVRIPIKVETKGAVDRSIRQWLYDRKPKVFASTTVSTLFKRAIDPEVKQSNYLEFNQRKRKRTTQSAGDAKESLENTPPSLEKLNRWRSLIAYKLKKRQQREHTKLLLQRQACIYILVSLYALL